MKMSKLNSLTKGFFTGLAAIVLGVSPSKAQYQPDANTVGLYHFDEGQGNVINDSSQQENHGTTSNTTWIEGLYGSALEFNGTDSGVDVPDSPSLDLTQFTLEANVKFYDGFSNNHRFIFSKLDDHGTSGNYEFIWSLDNNGFLRAQYHTDGIGETFLDTSFFPELNRWYHVALRYNGEYKVGPGRNIPNVVLLVNK